MRGTKHYIGLALGIAVLISALLFISVNDPNHLFHRPVATDIVMVGNDLVFVCDKAEKYGIKRLNVSISSDSTRQAMWTIESDDIGTGKSFPKLRRIKYGQEIQGFSFREPKALQKNVGYQVRIDMGYGRISVESFVIADDNQIRKLSQPLP